LRGAADGQRGRARRLRAAPPAAGARRPGGGRLCPSGRTGRSKRGSGERGIPALHAAAPAACRRQGRAGAPPGPSRRLVDTARVRGQHRRLPRQPHGHVVDRAAGDHRGVHRLRRLRAFLPGGGDLAARGDDDDRRALLQGLRHLRGGLPGAGRGRDGGGADVTQAPPRGRTVLTANEAAAYAAVLARVQAIACYPITPQTAIVERLAELVAGREDVEYANVESEHSMFGYVIAAARAGARSRPPPRRVCSTRTSSCTGLRGSASRSWSSTSIAPSSPRGASSPTCRTA